MKFLKSFSRNNKIEKLCNEYEITNYIIDSNGLLTVDGSVSLSHNIISEIPEGLSFYHIKGSFDISNCNMESFNRCPKYVDYTFNFSYNNIPSLDGSPLKVGLSFNMRYNPIYYLDNIGDIKNGIHYEGCYISPLINLFDHNVHLYLEYLKDYNFQNKRIIYKTRFIEALSDLKNVNKDIIRLPNLRRYKFI